MSIAELAKQLEDAVNKRLEEFEKLGKASRQLLMKKKATNKEKECLNNIYIEMAKITKELIPVHYFIFKTKPEYEKLFETLTFYYGDSSYNSAQESTPKNAAQPAKK